MGSDAGARAGVPGSAGAARAVRDIGARRRAAGHQERADVLPAGKPGRKTAVNQLDYAFASRGFHEKVSVQAMNEIEEWGPSDHCRLMIEVKDNARVAVPKESRAARFVQPASGVEVIKKRDAKGS